MTEANTGGCVSGMSGGESGHTAARVVRLLSLAAAPTFAGFEDAATSAGFRKGADGRYSYGSTEIVASGKAKECS